MNSFFIHYIYDLEQRSVNADKRRYIDSAEACKHYIDMDLYGVNPFDSVPIIWFDAKEKYSKDTLINRGILPWVIYWEYHKLIAAMDTGSVMDVVKYAADLVIMLLMHAYHYILLITIMVSIPIKMEYILYGKVKSLNL